MADPGMPGKVAAAIADDLADDLQRERGGRWVVEAGHETLPLGPDGEIRLTEHAPRLLQDHEWDFVLYLTDLPTRPDGVPLLYDMSGSTAAALVSMPVLGAIRVRTRTRKLALKLVCSGLHRDALGTPGADGLPAPEKSGPVNEARVLAGMVYNNRPTRMVPALSGVVAAAAATGAFGIFYGSIASLAVELHPLRLAMISILSVLTLVVWLIWRNGLWAPSDDVLTPRNRRMDNVATVLTVGSGVGMMYLGLLLAMFLLALAVMDAEYLQTQLGRPTMVSDYFHLAWLSSSLGTFAGALGANFDNEDTVREATYSLRWHERRKLFDNYESPETDRRERQERERIEREHGDHENSEGSEGAEGTEGSGDTAVDDEGDTG